jgi:hypothetical protein
MKIFQCMDFPWCYQRLCLGLTQYGGWGAALLGDAIMGTRVAPLDLAERDLAAAELDELALAASRGRTPGRGGARIALRGRRQGSERGLDSRNGIVAGPDGPESSKTLLSPSCRGKIRMSPFHLRQPILPLRPPIKHRGDCAIIVS